MGIDTLSHKGLAMTEEEFWAILYDVPTEIQPLRRLYYNDSGEPLFYATEDLPGNYIDIDPETFARASSQVRVRNGQIVSTKTHRVTRKLVPADHGVVCHVKDICVVVDPGQPHAKWTIKTYEQN
jgi:hypothetical protein